ncbi:MAG: hypothetical protein ACTS5F_01885 [Candidatus Hodgkinia cicadicola]
MISFQHNPPEVTDGSFAFKWAELTSEVKLPQIVRRRITLIEEGSKLHFVVR